MHAPRSAVFGKRREPHTIIIAHGGEIRHFTVRPWLVALFGSVLAAVAIGYLVATSYLVLRDDLIGATAARQARVQQAYEDRIAALRAQVDRITSRQLLDQQLMESKVSELLERQSQLSERHGQLGPIMERAGASSPLPASPPVPEARPDIRAALPDGLRFAGAVASQFWAARPDARAPEGAADQADRMFVAINRSLRAIETEQLTRLDSLAEGAYETVDAISEALAFAGLQVSIDYGREDVGGPLVAVDDSTFFETKVRELDDALRALDEAKSQARRLPIANPAPGRSVSSGYGVRRDPIIGRRALHAGMDFRAPTGSPVRATAAGTVTRAGWNGGYGRMVEIDHGNGFTTRYAHLSRIGVKDGDPVEPGTAIGKVGSTGRSTGPHLHYEVRRNGDPLDPLRFIRAGKEVGPLL